MTKNFKTIHALAALSLGAALVSCDAGSGLNLDENGRPLTEESNLEPVPETGATTSSLFNRVQDEILTPDCATSGCHNGTSSPLGLNLIEGKSWAKLVNKPSNQVSGLLLVEPSNADASYLMHKLVGNAGGGVQMPLGKPPLSADQLQLVRDWINDGAPEPSSGGGDNTGDSGDSGDTGSGVEPLMEPTLTNIQQQIFDTKCISCHSDNYAAGGLNLQSGKSHSQLVGRPFLYDMQNSVLVAAGDADSSLLVNKLTGVNLGNEGDGDYKGERMPLLGPYLDEATIQVVIDWINAGAKDN
ncbi:MAG: hypothetical protein KDJ38_17405 [Gammaproteobacteria bacterium]|nr:hypothetical protein [Gammaproteobacteria bacterium]